MIKRLIRYSVFLLVAGTLVYGGYRLLAPATPKPASTEKVEKEEHSEGVEMSDAKDATLEQLMEVFTNIGLVPRLVGQVPEELV